MLDLDSLAEKCAKTLNEQREKWSATLWSRDFQHVAQNMSDGEILILINHCKSVSKLEAVLRHLNEHTTKSPFAVLNDEATKAGKSLSDFINSF